MNQKELHNVSPQSASQMIDDDPPAILVNIGLSMEFLFVGGWRFHDLPWEQC